ncbi:hypothetical protein LCGC14_0931820 [marine sediment metagenome]|uniref:CAAX prenyl protease 2/Lysostaphin resistance protein A-like domain-containing protein n=1 Tax=marine sediment metagenome TaxID=412755 RepID=A0A0F9NSC9_9ZZZZ|nr:MAG: CAAX amino terminal protease self- immunity [Candidatus Lokiarchaeum sp. GC14_75]
MSKRALRRKNNSPRESISLRSSRINPLGILMLSFALLSEIYLIVKYIGKETSAYYSILLFGLGTIALIGMLWLTKGKFITYELPFMKDIWSGITYILAISSLVAVIGIMMLILQASFRFALELIDVYFYYLAAAVIEEAFFRMFFISFFIQKYPNKRIGIIIGVFVSSFIFMIAHWASYGDSLSLMLSMFFGGLLFSAYYLVFKDITISMLAHLIINLIVIQTTIIGVY